MSILSRSFGTNRMKHRKQYVREFKKIPFTQEGYSDMEKELKSLELARPAAVETLARARALGDLSENGMYKAARARLSSIDHRRERLKDLMKLALITKPSGREIVEIGSQVVLLQGEREMNITVVGGYESDPALKKISHLSPLGQALMGKGAGESVVVVAPVGTVKYKIVKIV